MRCTLIALSLALACGCSSPDPTEPENTAGQDIPEDTAPLPDATLDSTDDVATDPAEPPAETGHVLQLTSAPFAIQLRADGASLLSVTIEVGSVPGLDDTRSYDPYPMVVEDPLYVTLEDLAWHTVSGAALSDDGQSAELTFEGGVSGTLKVAKQADGRWQLDFVPAAEGPQLVFVRLVATADATEGFYGLGELFDDVNHRGKVRAMQLEIAPELESYNNEAHVPVPFVLGTTGWGLFVEDDSPSVFEVATQADDRVVATFGTGPRSATGLRFHIYGADHPLDLTKHYYDTTAYPGLPARWALGPWVWRDENDSQAQVLSDAQIMRDEDLPCSGMWIDRPYATGVNAFDWDPARFDDAPKMIGDLNAMGFRVALWHTPYADPKDEDVAAVHAPIAENGWYPEPSGAATSKWGAPIDLTNPDAYAYWQTQIRKYTDMGIEGFKLDYGEDVIVGLGGIRNPWGFFDGSDERTMHSGYQRIYHRTYAELLPKDGGFLLCRTGAFGDQRHGTIIWPGDLDANMTLHGEDTGDYVAVGGMPASMIAGLSLGPSGYPFYGSDTGGYRHSPPDKETFIRWFQQTALSSVMQIGTSENDTAWEFGKENVKDPEIMDLYRIYTRLHLRLWPLAWTLVDQLKTTGRPLQRPFGLQVPELGDHRWDQYFFGDDLLVAPIVVHGAREREVHFPAGEWVDWWSGEVYSPGKATVEAPLSKLPLYLRAGGLVPMLRPTIDTIAPTTTPDAIDSYATTPGTLWIRTAPGPDSTLTLFDGTVIAQTTDGDSVTVTVTPGDEFTHGFMVEIQTPTGPVVAEGTDGSVTVSAPPVPAQP